MTENTNLDFNLDKEDIKRIKKMDYEALIASSVELTQYLDLHREVLNYEEAKAIIRDLIVNCEFLQALEGFDERELYDVFKIDFNSDMPIPEFLDIIQGQSNLTHRKYKARRTRENEKNARKRKAAIVHSKGNPLHDTYETTSVYPYRKGHQYVGKSNKFQKQKANGVVRRLAKKTRMGIPNGNFYRKTYDKDLFLW